MCWRGHFAASHITLTEGQFVGSSDGAGAEVIRNWNRITDRTDEIVPAYGFTQAEREVASAAAASAPGRPAVASPRR